MSDLVSGNQCRSGGFLKGLANRGTRGTCTRCRVLEFLSVSSLILFLQHYGPLFHIYPSASDTGYFTEGSCSLNCLGGKFCSLSLPAAFLTQKIQNAFGKCLWKVLTALLNPWVLLFKTIHYVEEAAHNSLGTQDLSLLQQLALLRGTAEGCHRARRSAALSHLIPLGLGHSGPHWKKNRVLLGDAD